MNIFKFRAECLHDIVALLEDFKPTKATIDFEMEVDVVCTLHTVAECIGVEIAELERPIIYLPSELPALFAATNEECFEDYSHVLVYGGNSYIGILK